MVIEKMKTRSVVDPRIDKVHCCYSDQGNLQVKQHVKNLKITTGPSYGIYLQVVIIVLALVYKIGEEWYIFVFQRRVVCLPLF